MSRITGNTSQYVAELEAFRQRLKIQRQQGEEQKERVGWRGGQRIETYTHIKPKGHGQEARAAGGTHWLWCRRSARQCQSRWWRCRKRWCQRWPWHRPCSERPRQSPREMFHRGPGTQTRVIFEEWSVALTRPVMITSFTWWYVVPETTVKLLHFKTIFNWNLECEPYIKISSINNK